MDYFPDEAPWHVRLVRWFARGWSGLARIGAVLVWPFEAGLAFIVRLLVGGVEHVEDADFFMSRVLSWLFAPLRWVGRGLGYVAAGVSWPLRRLFQSAGGTAEMGEAVDAPGALARARWSLEARWQRASSEPTGWFGRLIAAPLVAVAAVSRLLVGAFLWLAEVLNLDGVIARLVYWTRPLWYPCAALVGFVVAWFVTRSRRQLAWGIPLVLVLVPVAWITAERVLWGKTRIAEKYRVAVAAARDEKAYERMQLFERKLTQLGVNTELTTFNIALGLAKAGNVDEAYERMRAIAPQDRPGFANAHLWIVQNILANNIHVPVEQGRALVTAHLAHVDSLGIKSPDLDLLRAYCAAYCGQSAEAAELLKPFVDSHPSAAIDRMRLDLLLNRPEEARQDAAIVEDFMQRSKRGGRSMTSDDYRWWCIAEELLAHQAHLRAALADWLKLDPGNQEAREMASRVNLDQIARSFADRTADPNQIAAAIRDLFAAGSISSEAQGRMFALYRNRQANPAVTAAFENLVQSTDLPPMLTEFLGTAAAADGNWNAARRLLEQAVHESPEKAAAWNNLAYALLKQGADLGQALAAAEKAVQAEPNNHHFRETRGQVFIKLERWQEAVDDLEFALNGIPQATGIHASLAEAYQMLGNSPLATSHRQLAQ